MTSAMLLLFANAFMVEEIGAIVRQHTFVGRVLGGVLPMFLVCIQTSNHIFTLVR
jgi:hypothetical protein